MQTSRNKPPAVDTGCPLCAETARRDEQILEALQTVRYLLNGSDGFRNPWLKLARVRAAVDEAMRLMQVRNP